MPMWPVTADRVHEQVVLLTCKPKEIFQESAVILKMPYSHLREAVEAYSHPDFPIAVLQ